MKNCDDEPSADQFVTKCQKFCDSVYERDASLTDAQVEELQTTIYRAMLYKVGKIDYSFANCCCVRRFTRQTPEYAEKLYKRLKIFIVVVLALSLGL